VKAGSVSLLFKHAAEMSYFNALVTAFKWQVSFLRVNCTNATLKYLMSIAIRFKFNLSQVFAVPKIPLLCYHISSRSGDSFLWNLARGWWVILLGMRESVISVLTRGLLIWQVFLTIADISPEEFLIMCSFHSPHLRRLSDSATSSSP